MTSTPLHALKSLSELALAAPPVEPLIVYDSVAVLATRLAADAATFPPAGDFQALAEKAAVTAAAIRTADRCQLDFRQLLGGAE